MVEMTGEELLNEIEKSIKEGERLFLCSIAVLLFVTVTMCLFATADEWIDVVIMLVTGCILSYEAYKVYGILCDMYYDKGQVEALVRLERIANLQNH